MGNDIKNLGKNAGGIIADKNYGSITNINGISEERVRALIEEKYKILEDLLAQASQKAKLEKAPPKEEISKWDFEFEKPISWKIIKPAYYLEFSVLSTDEIPCLYAFATERVTQNDNSVTTYDVITVFDYGPTDPFFIHLLNEQLESLNKAKQRVGTIDKVNEFIKERAEGYTVTRASRIIPVLHKIETLHNKMAFINIMQIETNIGCSYSLQIYINIGTNMLCFATSMLDIDHDKPFESALLKYEYVQDLVNIVIKTIKQY